LRSFNRNSETGSCGPSINEIDYNKTSRMAPRQCELALHALQALADLVCRQDLQTLDRRILAEFDELRARQQAALQQLRIPTFQVTQDAVLVERQRRVLESMAVLINHKTTNLIRRVLTALEGMLSD
jgi:hypothetical protein